MITKPIRPLRQAQGRQAPLGTAQDRLGRPNILLITCIALFAVAGTLHAQTVVERGVSKLFSLDPAGKLVYAKDAKGGRLPDFSHVGYHSGEQAIPDVPVQVTLGPAEGDDTVRIQAALDKVGALPLDKNGHRGALLLKRGVYRVSGSLGIKDSGVVLRGEGSGVGDTLIIAAGYDNAKYKRTFISVGNSGDIKLDSASVRAIVDDYVPVGARSFTVKSAAGYKTGDRIVVFRPSTSKWISAIGCDKLTPRWTTMDGKKVDETVQWAPGAYDFYFERVLTDIKGNLVTLDAPIVQAMDAQYGGGCIYHYETPGRITEVGIENLRLVSEFAKPIAGNPYGDPKQTTVSENHGWTGIKLSRNSENTWVRNVRGNYFGWSLVSASGKRATVQDCVNLGHASQITGGRRYPFMIDGQLNLMQRCVTFEGRHEFVNQAKTAGPNVFVDCVGFKSKSSAGPHHRYAVGNLYDNVKSENSMESRFRGNSGTGHGWAGTQTCFYNCTAPGFNVQAPPGGVSWVIGAGKSGENGVRVAPVSLYYQQVQERLGTAAVNRLASGEQRKHRGEYLWVKERLENEK